VNRRAGLPDKRGNNKDRAARKTWLLATYDPELGPNACRCFHCGKRLTRATVTADRIIPGSQGGTYRRENLRPACMRDNREQGDKMWQMVCPITPEVTP
jgi:hypothetical protein